MVDIRVNVIRMNVNRVNVIQFNLNVVGRRTEDGVHQFLHFRVHSSDTVQPCRINA